MTSGLVFIGGLHRSGTSPLHRMLASHPAASGFSNTGVPEDEGQHLQSLVPPARAHGGPGAFGRHPAAHLTESDERCTPEGAAQVLEEWSPYWDPSAQVKVEKSPPNIIRFRFLQGLFPGALAVAVIRHPLAVALATSKWTRGTSLSALVEHWCLVHERFAEDVPVIHPLLIIHYEHLIEDPADVASKLAVQLDITTEFRIADIRRDGNRRYAEMWREQTSRTMTRRAREKLVDRYAERVERLGYRLDDLEAPPSPEVWLRSR